MVLQFRVKFLYYSDLDKPYALFVLLINVFMPLLVE